VTATTERIELPVHLTRFVGREPELEALESLLRTTRLLTLTGAGGSGKTRLASELATRVGARYEQAVWVDFAPLADAAALDRIEPDYRAIDALIGPHDGVVLYPFWADPEAGEARARSFSRIVELGEDPATGSAAGPLCAYLARESGVERLTIRQGEEMGRPSVIEAEMTGEGGVRVSGSVVPLIDGTVELPR